MDRKTIKLISAATMMESIAADNHNHNHTSQSTDGHETEQSIKDQDDEDRKPAALNSSVDDLLPVQQLDEYAEEDSSMEFLPRPPSSVHGEAGDHISTIVDYEPWNHHPHPSTTIIPQTPAPLTLKEKLVMRERQRRIETERARLKRQFILSSTTADTHQEQASTHDPSDNNDGENVTDSTSQVDIPTSVRGSKEDLGDHEEGGYYVSVEEETLGEESMRAHPDEDDTGSERLGFNMERFLRNSETFNPQLEPMDENNEGVLMERFLKDTVTPLTAIQPVESAILVETEEYKPIAGESSHRSVSFDMETSGANNNAGLSSQISNLTSSLPVIQSDDGTVSLSMRVEASPGGDQDGSLHVEAPSSVASSSERGVNAAPTTDEPRMLRLTEADMQEMASIDEASIGNAPPSDRDEVMSEIGELADFTAAQNDRMGRGGSQDTPTTVVESSSQISGGYHTGSQIMLAQSVGSSTTDFPNRHSSSEPLPNAHMSNILPHTLPSTTRLDDDVPLPPASDTPFANRPRRHQSISPETIDPSAVSDTHSSTIVDGFDYDKNDMGSPRDEANDLLVNDDPYGDIPLDSTWCAENAIMNVSPLHSRAQLVTTEGNLQQFPKPPFYGALDSSIHHHVSDEESTPLLRQKTTTASPQHAGDTASGTEQYTNLNDTAPGKQELLHGIMNLIRKTLSIASSYRYAIVALLMAVDVLMVCFLLQFALSMCNRVGLRQFVLLLILLPLVLAVIGNMGFQNRNLIHAAFRSSTRYELAMSKWLFSEFQVAALWSGSLGLVVGLVAFIASSSDIAFASVAALCAFISAVATSATRHGAAHLFGSMEDRFPNWEKVVDRITFNLIGCIVFMGCSFVLLPEGTDEYPTCLFD